MSKPHELRYTDCQHILYNVCYFGATISMYGAMTSSLLMPNLVAFYAKLNEIKKMNFILR